MKTKILIIGLSLIACGCKLPSRIDLTLSPEEQYTQCVEIEAEKLSKSGALMTGATKRQAWEVAGYCMDKTWVSDDEIKGGAERKAYAILRSYIRDDCDRHPCKLYNRFLEVDY